MNRVIGFVRLVCTDPSLAISKIKQYPVRNGAALRKWFSDAGDHTLRLDYQLQTQSVVFDLGGYKGDFAAAIGSRYNCYVYVFEPVKRFFELCEMRFKLCPKIRCFNFAVSDSAGELQISDEDNSSSIVKNNSNPNLETVRVREFKSIVTELGVTQIDLLKINIEGGEYS